LQSKEELDKLELEQKERSAKEFDAALVRRAHCCPGFAGLTHTQPLIFLSTLARNQERINALSTDFERELAADRAAAEAQLQALAEFEQAAVRDANSGLFFQGLYKATVTVPAKKKGRRGSGQASEGGSDSASARRERMLASTTPTFMSGLPPAARGGVYAAVVGTLIALAGAQAGTPEGLSPEAGVATAAAIALLASRVYAEADMASRRPDRDR